MAGPGFAIEAIAEAFDLDKCGGAVGVEFFDGWGEDYIGTGGLGQGAIGVEGAGVAGEVLIGAELGGIDKDADGDESDRVDGGADEGGVAFVEGTHGGDETDGVAAVVSFQPGPLAEFGDGVEDFHQIRFQS